MPVRPHAFVVMPFGSKPAPEDPNADADSRDGFIDFNRVYRVYIEPALQLAGLEPFRADMEVRGGDIIPDMLQELLVADMVVADLTIDNPNVWYELGVRHALRSRGVVIVSGRLTPAFDLYTNRKLIYRMKKWDADPTVLEEDKSRLAEMVGATMDAWHGRKISPVYYHLPNLQEPDWKTLKIGEARQFWEQHDAWERHVDLARKSGLIGDVLVLANEAPVAAFRVDAWIAAGKALRRAARFKFALEHLEHGLERSPLNLDLLREKGICLQRLAVAATPGFTLDRARQHYRDILKDHPRDAETWALLGRIDKDAWTQSWSRDGLTPAQKRQEATYEDALLRAAIDSYTTAYRFNPGHYYSGINALTLMHLHDHLTGENRYDGPKAIMAGAVRFAAECETDPNQVFWARATLGDLEVLVGTPGQATAAYKNAVASNDKDWFALNSSRDQLLLLQALEFHPEHVEAGLAVFDRALSKLSRPDDWQPRQVILFSGHMIDAPDRPSPRFPYDKEAIAAQKIGEALDALGAGPGDLALSQAAAGGDLLFLEECRRRGVRCQVLLPFPEAAFISKSILPSEGGDRWRDRYYAMKQQLEDQERQFDAKQRQDSIRIMPDQLGDAPSGVDPFERCNLWLLYTTLACGLDKARFVCLWNGGGGDGTGGTAHMHDEVKKRTGRVTWIDTRKLWNV
ncbi:MAG TPA: TRAFs-binding domain-containing protein [Thermoanaerobaculia bacterium]